MRVAVCSTQSYDRQFLLAANQDIRHGIAFFNSHLCEETRHMVAGFPVVCVFERLLTFPNVLVTGHQGFFTDEALSCSAQTTLQNISLFESDGICQNEVTLELLQ